MTSCVPVKRVLSLVRWREYIRALFPGLRLSRPKIDQSDRCARIETELFDPSITAECRPVVEQEKVMHLDAAISQRRI